MGVVVIAWLRSWWGRNVIADDPYPEYSRLDALDGLKEADDELFSDAELSIAASNYEEQEYLFDDLAHAFDASRMTIEDLGRELGVTPSEAKAWIEGEVDLRLSELRRLANAVELRVSYETSAGMPDV